CGAGARLRLRERLVPGSAKKTSGLRKGVVASQAQAVRGGMLHLDLEGVVIGFADRDEAGRIQRRQVRLCRLESGDRGCVDAGGVAGCLPDQSRQRVVYLDRTWIDASGEVASAPRGPDCWVNRERLTAAVYEES